MNQAAAGGGTGPVGQTRNPLIIFVLSYFIPILWLFFLYSMLTELKNFLRKDEIVPWHMFIPYYNIYLLVVKVPKWVGEAKQRAGSQNPAPSGFLGYLLFSPYVLANDLNQVWNPRGLPAGATA